jgi:Tfp pilus assembly protein PilO
MMRRLHLREHLLPIVAVLGGLLALNLLFMLLVNTPRLEQARTADQTTAALEAAVRKQDSRVAQLQESVARLQHNRELLARFFSEDLATKQERLVAVQREIHRIAQTYQVQATQLKFTHEAVKGSDLVRMTVNIPLSGGYNNLRQFLNEVERSDLFLIIEAIQLQEGDQGGVMLSLNVRLATYFADQDNSNLRYQVEG